jgi:hypothetical protein
VRPRPVDRDVIEHNCLAARRIRAISHCPEALAGGSMLVLFDGIRRGGTIPDVRPHPYLDAHPHRCGLMGPRGNENSSISTRENPALRTL